MTDLKQRTSESLSSAVMKNVGMIFSSKTRKQERVKLASVQPVYGTILRHVWQHNVVLKTQQKELQSATLELGASTFRSSWSLPASTDIHGCASLCVDQLEGDIAGEKAKMEEAEGAIADMRAELEELQAQVAASEVRPPPLSIWGTAEYIPLLPFFIYNSPSHESLPAQSTTTHFTPPFSKSDLSRALGFKHRPQRPTNPLLTQSHSNALPQYKNR